MSPFRIFFGILAMAAAMLAGCDGCADQARHEPQASDAAVSSPPPRAAQASEEAASDAGDWYSLGIRPQLPGGEPITEEWFFVTGETDERNRYRSTVGVTARVPGAKPTLKVCSGVLVGPRLVLTAGNCVCGNQKVSTPDGGERTKIDATMCATSVTITTAEYEPSRPETGLGVGAMKRDYLATVRPHPALKILLDEEGAILSSEADLAVVLVDGPLLGRFPPVALADSAVQADEPLVMVGFGYDERKGPLGGKRRFRKYSVTKVLDSGARALFDQPKRHIYKGDSGGPCMRESSGKIVLAGIMSRSLGAEASFTSTYFYRDWIRQEHQRAASNSSSPR